MAKAQPFDSPRWNDGLEVFCSVHTVTYPSDQLSWSNSYSSMEKPTADPGNEGLAMTGVSLKPGNRRERSTAEIACSRLE